MILDRDLHNAWKDKQTIYIVNRDGTGLRQLVEEAGRDAWSPELSPDGSEVLYTQGSQIFKIDVNSGVRTQLTHILGGILAVIGLILRMRMRCRYPRSRICSLRHGVK